METNSTMLIIFGAVIFVTLLITAWASRRNTGAADHYVAGGNMRAWQNGVAIAGDYISVAAFLGTTGLIALIGSTGFLLAIGGMVSYLAILLLLAEPLRKLGKYTLADVLASRYRSTKIRSAMSINALTISILYMIAQLAGGGAIIHLLTGMSYSIAVLMMGLLVSIYVTLGGMTATTWIQIVKCLMLVFVIVLMALLVLSKYHFNINQLFEEVGAEFGFSTLAPLHGSLEGWNWISIALTTMLGAAGLPHLMIRFFTVPDARTARSSAIVAVWITAATLLFLPIIGHGAALLVGPDEIVKADRAGNLAAPQVAEVLGGAPLAAFVSAVVFATILAVVSGAVIAASGAFAHDLYSTTIKKGNVSEREQFIVARIAGLVACALATVFALGVEGANVGILATMALAVAASANLPSLLFTLFWKRFNTFGALTGIASGSISAVALILIGPNVMGDSAVFPLQNPGIVSIPLGFIGCVIGTLASSRRGSIPSRENATEFDQMQIRMAVGTRS